MPHRPSKTCIFSHQKLLGDSQHLWNHLEASDAKKNQMMIFAIPPAQNDEIPKTHHQNSPSGLNNRTPPILGRLDNRTPPR